MLPPGLAIASLHPPSLAVQKLFQRFAGIYICECGPIHFVAERRSFSQARASTIRLTTGYVVKHCTAEDLIVAVRACPEDKICAAALVLTRADTRDANQGTVS
jgi:hypothetical protein